MSRAAASSSALSVPSPFASILAKAALSPLVPPPAVEPVVWDRALVISLRLREPSPLPSRVEIRPLATWAEVGGADCAEIRAERRSGAN